MLSYSSLEPRNCNIKYFITVKLVFNVNLSIKEPRFSWKTLPVTRVWALQDPDFQVGLYAVSETATEKQFLYLVVPCHRAPAAWDRCEIGHLTFRHRASSILGQAFHYSPENAFYIFNQQIYFII